MMVGMGATRQSRKVTWIVAVLLFALVLYPLSIGPSYAVCVATNNPQAIALFWTAYDPLIKKSYQAGTLKILKRYINWCGKTAHEYTK
jgi:hypothetical protein